MIDTEPVRQRDGAHGSLQLHAKKGRATTVAGGAAGRAAKKRSSSVTIKHAGGNKTAISRSGRRRAKAAR